MISNESIPTLNTMFRFQWEQAQNSYVLLYPEGMIQLNGPAGEILALVDGEKPVAGIVADLKGKFGDVDGLESDVLEFLAEAHKQRWIEISRSNVG
ncbi:pyrroloquinoline quinone biosynthesis peptide chaperone PqqD [Pontibacterium granulatum]|uniref:pyrroloquinoline quinone biosynthesis peptide chaperone PqqD n=1 Tax=Pontibacterium granulatum TaxID=2036029 RepID=UPI00249C6476|nr:pyrroloquinoline quinone biosynthesis peptide chaperone PqqD [Pontibacterium granulatum]MDI3326350.1 pyrroloquinoline quinone biosynthesis peptide chaperone PqqD [Pontibacterium granulatum]